MDYFYTPPSLITNESLQIEGDELHHLSKVLRKKTGDEIYVVDGRERAYRVKVKTISRTTAKCEILETFDHWNEPDIDIKLGAALLKNPSRFDFMVEKCTELGVREIIPIRTQRTIVSKIHTERLRKIALAAMKQCGRSLLPSIHPIKDFGEALLFFRSCDVKLITHEKAERPLVGGNRLFPEPSSKSVGVLIGPEGGFSEEEIKSAVEAGFSVVSLGLRRLRSETAAIATVCEVLSGR